jgi:hypothetical protein
MNLIDPLNDLFMVFENMIMGFIFRERKKERNAF